ncbi:FeoB small GTPase domain-containing protein [Acerihabitans sp. KWT182]|uniref:FeoB small GTPase domain-containing protein n=1 Tax=Acerihabitans sp. KWT182 TaxID=3157919 RepID=A0AAU7QFB0_9GAMM
MPGHNVICVVGNPNCGKTTLFNALTGSRQTVGNWPGVTVEKRAAPINTATAWLRWWICPAFIPSMRHPAVRKTNVSPATIFSPMKRNW